jgi:hypothetical protein
MTSPVEMAMLTVGLRRVPSRDRGWVSRTSRWTGTGWPREARKVSRAAAGSLSC